MSGVKNGFVEHYDGTSWTLAPLVADSQFHGVATAATGDVWAVGDHYAAGGAHSGTQLEHFDGSTWTWFPEVPMRPSDTLNDIVSSSGAFWAVGETDTGTSAGTRPLVMELCPVRAADTHFSSSSTSVRYRTPVEFFFPNANTGAHELVDGSGLGLFDSGAKSPGTSFVLEPDWAGTYTVNDTTSGKTFTLASNMGGTPRSGTTASTFTIRWGSAPAPSGDVFDVQIERPGDSSFSDWKTGVSERSDQFTPDGGAGDYLFRARVRDGSGSPALEYSPPLVVHVTA